MREDTERELHEIQEKELSESDYLSNVQENASTGDGNDQDNLGLENRIQ